MPNGVAETIGGRVLQWMEDAPTIFDAVRRVLQEYDHAAEAVCVAQAEQDRVQQQSDALREEVRQLQAEVQRLQRERAEVAQWITVMVREVAARFPGPPPSA